jgi:hypothetical protein
MPTLTISINMTRPNTEISFLSLTAEDRAYIDTRYLQTGLLQSYTETMSSDGLIDERKYIWYIQNPNDSYSIQSILANDAVLKSADQRSSAYNEQNGIKKSNLFWEVRDDDGNILSKDEIPKELLFT